MKKVIKYSFIIVVLFLSTALDTPAPKELDYKVTEDSFKATPKMIHEIQKLDSLELRIDSLLNGKEHFSQKAR